MKSKEYIEKFRLYLEDCYFNRQVFIDELGKDFLEKVNGHPRKDPNTGFINFRDFTVVVRNFEAKFKYISEHKAGNPLSQGLWKAFYAQYVVPLRISRYPDMQKTILKYNNITSKRDLTYTR